MYTTNLPDGVMIPDMLVSYVEAEFLSDRARTAILKWVNSDTSQYMKDFWRKQTDTNITLCTTYGMPECVAFFSYMRQQMSKAW